MSKRVIDGFVLERAVLLCSECQSPFSAELLVEPRKLSSSDIVEADLHRVFNDPEIRAALLACCPSCKYCAWSSSFKPFKMNPELIRNESKIEPSKKYALAVKCARQKKVHSLDIAFIALNGLWCTRESGEPDGLWLELAIFEHEKGIAVSPSCPDDDGLSHLIMGELYRQHRDFEKALSEYELAELDTSTSREILHHQRSLATRRLFHPTALPLKIARMYFEIDDTAAGNALMDFEPPAEVAVDAAIQGTPTSFDATPITHAAALESAPTFDPATDTAEKVFETAKVDAPSSAPSSASSAAPLLAAISSLFSEKTNSLLAAYSNALDDEDDLPQPEASKSTESNGAMSLSDELTRTASQAGTEAASTTTSVAAIQDAAIQDAAVQAAPIQAAPVQAAPAQAAPIQAAPIQAAPVQAAPIQAAPAATVQTSTPVPAAPQAAEAASEATGYESGKAIYSPNIKSVSSFRMNPAAVIASAKPPSALTQASATSNSVKVPGATQAAQSSTATQAASTQASSAQVATAQAASAPLASAQASTPAPAPVPAANESNATRSKRMSTSEIIPPLAVSADTNAPTKAKPKKASAPAAAVGATQTKAAAANSAKKEPPAPRSRASVITAPQSSSVTLSVTAVPPPPKANIQVATNSGADNHAANNSAAGYSASGNSAASTVGSSSNTTGSSATEAPKKAKAKRVKPAREDFHFARNPIARNVSPNRMGWINDYGNQRDQNYVSATASSTSTREEKVETKQRPAEQTTQVNEPAQQRTIEPARRAEPAPRASEPAARAVPVAQQAPQIEANASEVGAPLPGLAIDDPIKGKDYSDAINRVENYLSFSRRVSSRNWMKL